MNDKRLMERWNGATSKRSSAILTSAWIISTSNLIRKSYFGMPPKKEIPLRLADRQATEGLNLSFTVNPGSSPRQSITPQTHDLGGACTISMRIQKFWTTALLQTKQNALCEGYRSASRITCFTMPHVRAISSDVSVGCTRNMRLVSPSS